MVRQQCGHFLERISQAVPPGLFLWVSFSRAKSAGFLPLAAWGRVRFYRPSHDTSEVWLRGQWTSKPPSVVSEETPNLLLEWVKGHHLPGVKSSLCKFPPTLFHSSALHPRCQRHGSLQLQELPKVRWPNSELQKRETSPEASHPRPPAFRLPRCCCHLSPAAATSSSLLLRMTIFKKKYLFFFFFFWLCWVFIAA